MGWVCEVMEREAIINRSLFRNKTSKADPGLIVLLDRPSIQIHIEVKLYEVDDGTAMENKRQ